MLKLNDSKIKEIQENIINWYEDSMTQEESERNYFIVSLSDDIERCLIDPVEDQVINSLKNDYDYTAIDDEDEKEYYINENKFDRLIELSEELRNKMYSNIVSYYENLGYDCYEGEFFPCDGNFKNLYSEQIAFVK